MESQNPTHKEVEIRRRDYKQKAEKQKKNEKQQQN